MLEFDILPLNFDGRIVLVGRMLIWPAFGASALSRLVTKGVNHSVDGACNLRIMPCSRSRMSSLPPKACKIR
jgi:hypothetical protein